jgi:hypothetical protein
MLLNWTGIFQAGETTTMSKDPSAELKRLRDRKRSEEQAIERRFWKRVLGAIVFVAVAWGITTFGIPLYLNIRSTETDLGKRSDNINALFSGLALIGIVVAVILQRKEIRLQRHELRLQRRELRLQREELEMTRAELKRSADAQAASEKALARQADSLLAAAKLNAVSNIMTAQKAIAEIQGSARQEGSGGLAAFSKVRPHLEKIRASQQLLTVYLHDLCKLGSDELREYQSYEGKEYLGWLLLGARIAVRVDFEPLEERLRKVYEVLLDLQHEVERFTNQPLVGNGSTKVLTFGLYQELLAWNKVFNSQAPADESSMRGSISDALRILDSACESLGFNSRV